MSKFLDSNGVAYLWGKVKEHVAGKVPTKTSQLENDSGYLTEADVPDAVTVDSALSATSTNPVQNKAINTALAGKVDKVSGKGLSANDYTTAEKTKLSGIAEGANKTTVVNNLTSTSTASALSAAQGKALKDMIDNIDVSGGNGLPEGGEPNAMLVTDADGATKWDQRTHWAEPGAKQILHTAEIVSEEMPFMEYITINKGSVYTVEVDGMTYQLTAVASDLFSDGVMLENELFKLTTITDVDTINLLGFNAFLNVSTELVGKSFTVTTGMPEIYPNAVYTESVVDIVRAPLSEVAAGDEVIAVVDHRKYECVAGGIEQMGLTLVTVGNQSILGVGEDTGEPFVLAMVPPDLVESMGGRYAQLSYLGENERFSFGLYGQPEIVHKLDAKYLPDGYGSGSADSTNAVSVKDFGAVGDGVTDDTNAIRAALAASSNVYAPEGVYLISSQLTFRDNDCRFRCDGEIKVDHCVAFHIMTHRNDLYIRRISTVGWATGEAGQIGSAGNSPYYNNIEIGTTDHLLMGIWLSPNGEGIAYTNVKFKEIRAEFCINFNPTNKTGSFINENTFTGGALVGGYPIYISKNGATDPFNGNKFYNIGLEGCSKGMKLEFFQFNEFHGCRFSKWENSWDTFIEFGEDANRNTFNYTGFVFANQLVQNGENPEYYNYFDGLIKYTDDATDGVDIGKRGYFAKNQMIIKDCDRYYDYVDINQTVDLSTQPFAIEGRTYNVTATEGTELVLTLPRGYWYGDATFFYVNLICEGTPNVVLRHPEGFMAALTEPGLYKVQCNDVRGWFAHKLV